MAAVVVMNTAADMFFFSSDPWGLAAVFELAVPYAELSVRAAESQGGALTTLCAMRATCRTWQAIVDDVLDRQNERRAPWRRVRVGRSPGDALRLLTFVSERSVRTARLLFVRVSVRAG